MSGGRGTLQQIAAQLAGMLQPLQDGFRDPDAFRGLLYELGWEVSGLPPSYVTVADKAVQADEALRSLADNAGVAETLAVIARAGDVYRAVDALAEAPAGVDPAVFLPELGHRLFELLLGRQLLAHAPQMFATLQALGIIALEDTPETVERPGFTRLRFDWDQVPAILQNPSLIPERVYGWGTPHLKFTKIAELIGQLAVAAGLPTSVDLLSPALATALQPTAGASAARTARQALTAVLFDVPVNGQYVEVGVMLAELPAEGSEPPGLILQPLVPSGMSERIELGDGWAFVLRAGTDLSEQLAIAIRPGDIEVRYPFAGGQAPPRASLGLSLVYDADAPLLLFGEPDRTRLELTAITLGLAVDGELQAVELKASAEMRDFALVLSAQNADGFLLSVLGGKDLRVAAPFALSWSSRTGLDMLASAGIAATVFPHVEVGGIRIDRVDVALEAAPGIGASPGLRARASATLSGALGPVAFSVDRLGVHLPVTSTDGNAGPFDVTLKPLLPTGIGLVVDAPSVTGGGFLFFDPEKEEYAGILQLELAETIALTAIGLLTTRLPDGSKGYSLLISITAQGFQPIQLGLGFRLSGIGGLIGVNRTVAVDVLRAGLKKGSLDAVLFPDDPVRNAAQIVSSIRTVFPPAEGRFVFGPMVVIDWGTPPVVTMDLAVILEVPSPVRLIVLGQIRAALPRAGKAVIQLKMDVLGVLEIDKGELAIDAVLHDSRALTFAVTGDMALRARWLTDPTFILAAGGLNPHFTSPAGFPTLQRLAISLATGDNPRLRLEAYLALTSNTAQIGARLDLRVAAAGFSIEGYLQFDALFQFSPFQFIVEIGAGVTLKWKGRTLVGVQLALTLEGPSPWHAAGKATFKIWIFSKSVSFDKTFGKAERPAALPPADPLPELVAALGDRRSWAGGVPTGSRGLVIVRDTASPDLRVHPLGQLTVRQRVVPLEIEITKFGNTAPARERRFRITAVHLGGQRTATQPVTDYFAPGQFLDLTETQRLTRPSFEPLPSGIELTGDVVHFGGQDEAGLMATADIGYETVPPALSGRRASPAPPAPLSAEALQVAAAVGAAAQAAARRPGHGKYRGQPRDLTPQPPTYVVAHTADLAPADEVAGNEAAGTSYTAAAHALATHLAAHPDQRGRLKIVAPHELARVA